MPSDVRERISKAFSVMMDTLHNQKGANLKISIMTEPGVTGFIDEHAAALDGAIQKAEMTDAMRQRLQRSNWVFSGMKTFHELNEAFPSLLDENGNRKPFERFLNDVQKIDRTYNGNYLRAEYNFVQASAEMAAKWESFMEDGDRYNLQYRTAKDNKVRPEHAELDGVTLPPSDPFWAEFYPPNGWNCRCTVVQVRKSKYPETPHDEAMERGEGALQRDSKGMFRFNPGIEQKTVPDYNPYTIKRCKDCDIAKGKTNLAFLPSNMLCQGCQYIRECYEDLKKSESSVLRTHYLHEMERLLNFKHPMPTKDGERIMVGFTKIGNEHLYSDTFRRSKILRKEDLKSLDQLLTNATCIDDKELTEEHSHNIVHFYYYRARLHKCDVRLNVAKEKRVSKKGQVRIRYYLYSINDIKE